MADSLVRLQSALADRYTIERELGAGGMATVYLAHDLRHNRQVAIKLLNPELSSALGPERFRQEITLTANLQHPNILPLFDSGAAEGRLWYAMPYVQGESLRKRLDREGALSPSEAGRLAEEVADALAYAHRAGIIHRDVKPANVLLSGGHALLADFGIAHAASVSGDRTLTGTGMVLGTPTYMSPEQALGTGGLTPSSDVYALGCVLYEMLTGQPLVSGASPGVVLAQKLDVGTAISGVPAKLTEVVRRAVSLDPSQRYQTAEAFGAAIADALALETAAGRAVQRSARRGRMAAVLATAAMIVVIGLALLAIQARSRRVGAMRSLEEVQRLVEARDFETAFQLAQQVGKVIPDDPGLAAVWPRISYRRSITTDPRGARVYQKSWSLKGQRWSGEWEYVGTTPTDSLRFALWTVYRFKFEKPGYRTVEHIWFSGRPIKLDSLDSLPADMVRARGFTRPFPITADSTKDSTRYRDYFVDRLETSNRQYQIFVDSGGYARREYWKHPFEKDGRRLTWEQAMALLVDRTGRPGPSTWSLGHYPEGQAEMPVGGISWYEAEAYATFAGKSLPTVSHWFEAADLRLFEFLLEPISNLTGRGPWPVGQSGAVNTIGAVDMVGNVREWIFNEDRGTRWILGGGWSDPALPDRGSLPAFDRSPENGVRLFKYSDDSATLAIARGRRDSNWGVRDYSRERPVSAQEFQGLLRAYKYDKEPLEPRIERVDTAPLWVRERVTFSAAYPGDRMVLYLYLPRRGKPPYQSVVYFPGSGALNLSSPDQEQASLFDFFLTTGRAVALPAYKGTYDRDDANNSIPEDVLGRGTSVLYRDLMVAWSKDLCRSVDYLVTRPDMDSQRIGYYGFSWGGYVAPIMLVTEPRLRAAVLFVGGLWGDRPLPEADEFNFLPRVTVPVLMINGKYDQVFDLKTQQEPFFRLLGTPPAHKRHFVYAAGHWAPPDILMRETLQWFDRYFGKPAGAP